MSVRFAGDFFGVPLTTREEDQGSLLLDYFPDLRSTNRAKAAEGDDEGARSFRGVKAVGPFTGFKTLQKSGGEDKAPPAFGGFKEF